MTELLRVEGLVAGYGEAVVIQGLSLSVRAGQTLALLGRNGTGKTTLINTLVGTTRRFAGQIWLEGQPIEGWPSHRRVTGLTKGGLGWVPQERGVFKSLTVHENLSAVARAVHGVHAWTPQRVFALFPRLAERRDNLGSQLSGGEQQMLAVGRALVVNPSLLLLDEPLEGLAPIIVQELLAAIRHITREEGLSTIIVEQHPDLVLAMSDEAVVLERGQIVHRERASILRTQPDLLQRLMGVE